MPRSPSKHNNPRECANARRLLVSLLFLGGCHVMPAPPPVLPSAPGRSGFSVVEGTQIAPASATISAPGVGPVHVNGRFEGNDDGVATFLFDPRVAYAHTVSNRWQVAGHISFLTNGLELRYAPTGLTAPMPVVLTAGLQTDTLLSVGAFEGFGFTGRLGASMHPQLSRTWELALGLGVAGGALRRAIRVPETLGQEGVDQQFPANMRVLRHELRVEALLGIGLRIENVKLLLAAQPFWVVAHGDARGSCFSCVSGARLESYSGHWGAAVTLTFYWDAGR